MLKLDTIRRRASVYTIGNDAEGDSHLDEAGGLWDETGSVLLDGEA